MADVERARRWLSRRPPSSLAVHEARRRLRRARAVLRLARGTAVASSCARARSACRRAARALSPLRDARAFAETLEDLLDRGGGDLPSRERAEGRALARRARMEEARGLVRGAALRRARAALRAGPLGPRPSEFARAVAPALGRGLRRQYRRGRRDFLAARSSPRPGRLHALRKDCKVLLHELEAARAGSGAAAGLRRLAKVLGEERDLAALRGRLGRSGRPPAGLERLARRRQRRLRRRALRLAGELYAERARNVAMMGNRS